ncbi:hypothetical protein DVH05_010176 [Phytophthora capsici]|nr:hypothetical protein DVH05_010176 [Phytophthora capsici]
MAKKRTNTTAPTGLNTSKRAKVISLSSLTTATLKTATSAHLALPGAAVAAVHAEIPEATTVRNSGEVQPRSNAELLIAIDEILGREDAVCADNEENGAGDLLRAPESALTRVTTAAITNWTVKNPGKVVPPTSNNYHTWTVLQLRRECTERNLRLPRSTPKTEQIKKLEAYDAA